MRFFIFEEESEELPGIYESPEAWAKIMKEERGLPEEVTNEIVQKFADPSLQEFCNAAARFYWMEICPWFYGRAVNV